MGRIPIPNIKYASEEMKHRIEKKKKNKDLPYLLCVDYHTLCYN